VASNTRVSNGVLAMRLWVRGSLNLYEDNKPKSETKFLLHVFLLYSSINNSLN
jgi:hypothetical protein